jgi:hypothetical protein
MRLSTSRDLLYVSEPAGIDDHRKPSRGQAIYDPPKFESRSGFCINPAYWLTASLKRTSDRLASKQDIQLATLQPYGQDLNAASVNMKQQG